MITIAISLTKPLETFVQRKLAEGYASPDEVARQALLRWMEEDEGIYLDARPPGIDEKIREAARSPLRPVREEKLSWDKTFKEITAEKEDWSDLETAAGDRLYCSQFTRSTL